MLNKLLKQVLSFLMPYLETKLCLSHNDFLILKSYI